jgi:hypothetical protein
MDTEKLNKMRTARHLLPFPGGEVVGECIAEIDRLREELEKWKRMYRHDISDQPLHPCCRAKECLDSPDGVGCACSGCTEYEEAKKRAEAAEAKEAKLRAVVEAAKEWDRQRTGPEGVNQYYEAVDALIDALEHLEGEQHKLYCSKGCGPVEECHICNPAAREGK